MSPRGPVTAAWMRRDAERISGSLPPLLIEAERLVSTLHYGVHGRRRPGSGETFWQYRAAQAGDNLGDIDWRKSARSDRLYLREMEWESAESCVIWCDRSRAMDFRSDKVERSKADRAKLLTLAITVLLSRGGERVGLLGTEAEVPRTGEKQIQRVARILSGDADMPDYGAPPKAVMPKASRAVFLSDFMGPRDAVLPALGYAAGQGTAGVYVQILDPVEELFPFRGRTRFESMASEIRHDTDQAASLRDAYLARLAERRDDLMDVARRAGWQVVLHRTDESPRKALLALHRILGGGK